MMKLNLVKATLTAAIISTIASAQAQTSEAVVSIIDYPHCSQEQSNQKQKHEPAMRQFTDLLKEELNTQTNKPSNQELEDLIKKSLSIYMCRFQTIEGVDDEKLGKLEEKIFTVFKKIILDKDLSNSDRDRIDNLARELNSEFKKIVISAEKDQNSYCVESGDIIQDVECNRNIGATDNDLSVIIADWIQSRFPGIPENKKIDELTGMLIENILGNLDQSEEQRLVESLEGYSKK